MNELPSFEKEITIAGERLVIKNERIKAQEYIEFLTRTDLGNQYPREDFANRIATLLQNIQISLVVRNAEHSIVAICFGLTDFAYWLFLTDLGVTKHYERKGIGKILVALAHELAGGERKIIQILCAADNAIPFYLKAGMKKAKDMMVKDTIEWTAFQVKKEFG